jgi:hypothetical protein
MAGNDTSSTPRYDPSIYDTPFSKLPNPKRVWIGEPGSALEGIGTSTLPYSLPRTLRGDANRTRSSLSLNTNHRLGSRDVGDQNGSKSRLRMGHDEIGVLSVWTAEMRA